MWVDADLVKNMDKSVNDCFEFEKFSQKALVVFEHYALLASSHDFDTIDKAAMCFRHAEQKHGLATIIEDLTLVQYQIPVS